MLVARDDMFPLFAGGKGHVVSVPISGRVNKQLNDAAILSSIFFRGFMKIKAFLLLGGNH